MVIYKLLWQEYAWPKSLVKYGDVLSQPDMF